MSRVRPGDGEPQKQEDPASRGGRTDLERLGQSFVHHARHQHRSSQLRSPGRSRFHCGPVPGSTPEKPFQWKCFVVSFDSAPERMTREAASVSFRPRPTREEGRTQPPEVVARTSRDWANPQCIVHLPTPEFPTPVARERFVTRFNRFRDQPGGPPVGFGEPLTTGPVGLSCNGRPIRRAR